MSLILFYSAANFFSLLARGQRVEPVPLVFEECERLDERKDDGVVGTRVDSMVQLIKAKLVALREEMIQSIGVWEIW